MTFHSLTSRLRHYRRHLLAVCLLAGIPALLPAQEAAQERPSLSEPVAIELGKLAPLLEAENWDGALQILEAVAPKATAGTYDEAVVAQMRAQLLLQKGEFAPAIPPLERTLQLGLQNSNFFDANALRQYTYYLSQLYYQEANVQGKPLPEKEALFQKSIDYIRDFLTQVDQPTPEQQQFVASLYFARSQLNPENVDTSYLEAALEASREGLTLSLAPDNRFYLLTLAALQQLGRIQESIDFLEIMVKREPTNSNYWQQLAASYLSLAAEEKNERIALELNVRSVITILRAQQQGHMTTSRDYLNLASIYFNIQQYDRAIGVLENGLRNGTVENTLTNWEILAQSYQQLKRELKAVEILKEALTHYPDAGKLDFTIATIYYQLNDLEAGYKHAASAIDRGNLENLGQVQQFASYAAFELKRYEEALAHANAAIEAGAKDAERLRDHIQSTIADRNAALQLN